MFKYARESAKSEYTKYHNYKPKDFTVVSNGTTYKNINKYAKLKKLEKKLIREQRTLSRKYENLKKGESTQKKVWGKKLHHRINHKDSKNQAILYND